MKLMTIVGTRPEIIRLSRTIAKCDVHFDHVLVDTGQNFDNELSRVFFQELGIRDPDIRLGAAGETAARTIAQVIERIDTVLDEQAPDAVLILGDTNSALAALPAKRRHIPVFHWEAGNRCFDFRVPEEINRRIVDHIADINLTYTQIARDYLIAEGFPADQVICTGSPMREVIEFYRDEIERSGILERLGLQRGRFFLVSSHREGDVDSSKQLQALVSMLKALREHHNLPVLFSTHPRTRKRLATAGLDTIEGVTFHKPFGYFDYVKLQMTAKAVLSDSGTITEESSILNFPALNLREAHERPEGMEEGAVMMTGMNVETVLTALSILETQPRGADRAVPIVRDYSTEITSDKIVRIILSYTDYVNRKVWRKY